MKIALIVGAGFSVPARLPPTNELAQHFLKPTAGAPPVVDAAITDALQAFWRDVFGASPGVQPTLEDHFTMLDLAANTGHQLGKSYPPRRLRAIRRLSIHRTFQILDRYFKPSLAIRQLLERLKVEELSIVSLNWDIVAERHLDALGVGYDYDIDVRALDDTALPAGPMRLHKMHGSSNWLYCDSCRQLYAPPAGKAALNLNAYLEPDDFRLLGRDDAAAEVAARKIPSVCARCDNPLAGRLATFSYRKAFSINQFQTIWDRAYSALARADRWLFIGYSMPEADFEFRHLLKAAQLARRPASALSITMVCKDKETAPRFRAFFGDAMGDISEEGLEDWVNRKFAAWIAP